MPARTLASALPEPYALRCYVDAGDSCKSEDNDPSGLRLTHWVVGSGLMFLGVAVMEMFLSIVAGEPQSRYPCAAPAYYAAAVAHAGFSIAWCVTGAVLLARSYGTDCIGRSRPLGDMALCIFVAGGVAWCFDCIVTAVMASDRRRPYYGTGPASSGGGGGGRRPSRADSPMVFGMGGDGRPHVIIDQIIPEVSASKEARSATTDATFSDLRAADGTVSPQMSPGRRSTDVLSQTGLP